MMSNEPKIQNKKESNKMNTIETTQDESAIIDSLEDSASKNTSVESKYKIHEFIFATPISKIKKEPIMPSTPHKIQSSFKYEEFIAKGRNLMEIFEFL